MSGFAVTPPLLLNVAVYWFTLQFAVYVLFPVLPFTICKFLVGVVTPVVVQPVKVCPTLLGSAKVIVFVSIVYELGFPLAFVPPSRLYVIV